MMIMMGPPTMAVRGAAAMADVRHLKCGMFVLTSRGWKETESGTPSAGFVTVDPGRRLPLGQQTSDHRDRQQGARRCCVRVVQLYSGFYALSCLGASACRWRPAPQPSHCAAARGPAPVSRGLAPGPVLRR